MDYNTDMFDKPSFKTKKGKGIVDDVKNFVKKHKKTLKTVAGATAGTLGALALGALATRKGKRKEFPNMEKDRAFNFFDTINKQREGEAENRFPVEEEMKRPSTRKTSHVYTIPQAVPIPKLQVREDIKNPFGLEGYTLKPHPPTKKGAGKKNSLLKAVQAYKKQHGCTLKEAWASVKAQHGSGIIDDVKNFVKKNKKKIIAGLAGTAGLVGATALGSHLYNKHKNRNAFGSHKSKLLVEPVKSTIKPIEDVKNARNRRSSLIHENALDYIDVGEPPILDFSKPYSGAGILDKIKEFAKKHKKKIIAGTAGLAGTALAGTIGALAHREYKKRKINRELGRFLNIGDQNLDRPASLPFLEPEEKRDDYGHRSSALDVFRHENDKPLEFPEEEHVFRPRSWIQLAENYDEDKGAGVFDKIKEFAKKHEKTLKTVAGVSGALATGALLGHQYIKNQDLTRYNDLLQQRLRDAWIRNLQLEPIREEAHGPGGAGYKKLPNPNSESGLWEGDENYEKPLCRCGNDSDKILDSLGGAHLGKLIMKHPKHGLGLISSLHSGITSGFNFLGSLTLDTLIEIAVRLVGEPFRKPITRLVKKYGWQSIAVIKKYAHKGLTAIKNALKTEMVKNGHGCCSECENHLEKQFLGGRLKCDKYGMGFWDDVGNYVFGALHRVGDVIQGVIPGTIGKAIAYIPKQAGKMGELVAPNYKFKDPYSIGDGMQGAGVLDDMGNYIIGALHRVGNVAEAVVPGLIGKAIGYIPKQAGKLAELLSPNYRFKDPYTIGDGMCGGSSTFEKIIDLIPFELLSEVAVEKARHSMGIPSVFDRRKTKKGGKKIPLTIKKIGDLVPWEILTKIFAEFLNIPEYGIIPERHRLRIWPQPEGGAEMSILPYEETANDAKILPYYGKGKTQDPNMNQSSKIMAPNHNSDYKAFSAGMTRIGGKAKKSKKSKKSMKGKKSKKSMKKKLTKKAIKKILKILKI